MTTSRRESKERQKKLNQGIATRAAAAERCSVRIDDLRDRYAGRAAVREILERI